LRSETCYGAAAVTTISAGRCYDSAVVTPHRLVGGFPFAAPEAITAAGVEGDSEGESRVRSFASLEPPDTCYAKSGDLSIAYQVIGEGPLDLVYTGSWTNQIEHAWELASTGASSSGWRRSRG
jgi:hypothetical protein